MVFNGLKNEIYSVGRQCLVDVVSQPGQSLNILYEFDQLLRVKRGTVHMSFVPKQLADKMIEN